MKILNHTFCHRRQCTVLFFWGVIYGNSHRFWDLGLSGSYQVSPLYPLTRIWTTDLQNYTRSVPIEATKCVVICYSGNRKLTHRWILSPLPWTLHAEESLFVLSLVKVTLSHDDCPVAMALVWVRPEVWASQVYFCHVLSIRSTLSEPSLAKCLHMEKGVERRI